MKKRKTTKLVLLCTICLMGVSLFAQSPLQSAVPDVIRLKFTNEPAIIQKMETAISSRGAIAQSEIGPLKVAGLAGLNRLNRMFSATEMKRVFRPAGKHEQKHRDFGLHLWYEIKYQPELDLSQAIEAYSDLSYIQIANPVYTTEMSGVFPDTINDPRYGEQWHYENNGSNGGTVDADIDLQAAWAIEAGNPNVVVAIEDGGIDVNHPDLVGNLWTNPGEIAGNGIDDDNNGYIDDVHGFNFAQERGKIEPHDHGTHVAGTIGAETNNGIGVAGIAGGTGADDGVRLMSCQVFSSDRLGGFAEAFTYAADNGAVISQNSWGHKGAGVFDQAVKDGIDYFIENAGGPGTAMNGGIVIFAAGNHDADGAYYPGYYDAIMAVSGVNNQDKKAWYSNFGTWVDIAAPGGETRSTNPRGVLSTWHHNRLYGFAQGTSMACPHVSGVAALVVSKNYGNITAGQLWNILVNNTDPIDNVNPGFEGKLGTGRLNAHKAVAAAMPVDNDGDGYNSGVDCDDNNPDVNPGAYEIPDNNIDDDCDGQVDEPAPVDNDGDGYNSDVDCDDNNADVNPGAPEVPGNNIDDDCDGQVDEDDCPAFGISYVDGNTLRVYRKNEGWTGHWNYICLNGTCNDGTKDGGLFYRDYPGVLGQKYDIEVKIQDDASGQYVEKKRNVEFTKQVCANVSFKSAEALTSSAGLSLPVYPNPVKGVLYLGVDEPASYKVFDLLGSEVIRGEGSSVNVSGLEAGNYVVVTNSKRAMFVKE